MNIYVGNLPFEVTEEELRREFIIFGEVLSVTIMNDKYIGSGQPKGYGYVEMPTKSAAEVAVNNLNGKLMKGRAINVVGALPLSDARDAGSNFKRRNNYIHSKTRHRDY